MNIILFIESIHLFSHNAKKQQQQDNVVMTAFPSAIYFKLSSKKQLFHPKTIP
jgi:hypothetical protein